MGCPPKDTEPEVVETGTKDVECPDNPETFGAIISTFTNEQVPAYVRQNHPLFVQYLEGFGEFLELPANPVGRITCYPDLTDVDFTTDEFFYLFKQTFLNPFPETFLADRALVTKKIKDFYAAKGTIPSLRLLFRILFNEEISVFLPKTKILRASHGKWQQNIRIFTLQRNGDPFELGRTTITGQTSGATAVVDFVEKVQRGSFEVYEMVLLEFDGTFEEGEIAAAQECPDILSVEIMGVVQDVTVINPGDDYQVGDPVIINHPDGIEATAEVCEVDATNPVVDFTINDGGNDYRVGDPIIFTGTGGVGAVARVDNINITSTAFQDTKIIAEEQNTLIDDVKDVVIQDFLNFELIERGIITGIEILDGGKFYPDDPFLVGVGTQLPAPCIGWPAGDGAEILALTGRTGKILDICVTNPGVGYTDTATADLTGSGNGLATGTPVVNGGPVIDSGFYRNTDGFLSWDQRLQDNVFWQNYSYEITSTHSINEWRDTVKAVVHPAGYGLFGNLCLLENQKLPFRVNTLPLEKCIVVEIDSTGGVINHEEDVDVMDEGFIACPTFDPFPTLIRDYADLTIDFFADRPIIDLVTTDSDPCYQQNLVLFDFETS